MIRTVAPSEPVVSLTDIKAHLRVDHDDEDTSIEAMEAAAVAHLDGYRGILGRCIRRQKWRQDFTCGGTHRLALPDVLAVAVTAGGEPVEHELVRDGIGWAVLASGPVSVEMECALPEDALPAVQHAVRLLVGHWYANRETVAPGSMTDIPMAFRALIASLRVSF